MLIAPEDVFQLRFSDLILLGVGPFTLRGFSNQYLTRHRLQFFLPVGPFSSLICEVALMVTYIVELWKEKE